MSKKIIILLSVLILATSTFTSCGDSAKPVSSKQILKVKYAKTGFGSEWIESIAKEFELVNPGVKVELEGDARISQKIETRLAASSDLADVYAATINWGILAAKGYLADISDVYNADTDSQNGTVKINGKIKSAFVEGTKYQGKNYALPWSEGSAGIVYNKTMFDKFGWKVPITVSELIELCNQIRNSPVNKDEDANNDIKPFIWPGQVSQYWDYPVLTWWAQYSGIEKYDTFFKYETKDVFADEGRLKALEVYENLIGKRKDNYVNGSESKDHIAAQIDFAQSKAAMIPDGSWVEKEIGTSLPKGLEIRMMATPYIDGAKKDANGKPIQINNGWSGFDNFIIPAKAAHIELAKKFLIFSCSDKMLKLYTQKTGSARPFNYSVDDITGLTGFSKSVLDIWQNSQSIYQISTSPMHVQRMFSSYWPTGLSPYISISSSGKSASTVFEEEIAFVNRNWDAWSKLVGSK